MENIKAWNPGRFCWCNLATPDLDRAKTFYSELFNWKISAGADPKHNALASRDGHAVAAFAGLRDTPTHWSSYVFVTSADDTARRAETIGGKLHGKPFDVLELGRIAVVQDPSGAVLALWQPKKHRGAELYNAPGAMCWNELYTDDPQRTGKFYGDLFGWTDRTEDLGQQEPYTFFESEKEPIAGMMKIDPSWGPMRPWWCVHFRVEDCDASAKKLARLGGTVGRGPFDVPGIGRLAMVSDPFGAAFALFTPKTT